MASSNLGVYYAFNMFLVGAKENEMKDDKGNKTDSWYQLTFIAEDDTSISFTCGQRIRDKLEKMKHYDLNLNYVYDKGVWKLKIVDVCLSSGQKPIFNAPEPSSKGAK